MLRSTSLMAAAALLVLPAFASAASAPALLTATTEPARGVLVHVDADGITTQPWSGAGADRVLCSGVAPLQNSCHVVLDSGTGWSFGWYAPPPLIPGTPVNGPVAYSLRLVLSGTNGAQPWVFECNLEGAGVAGAWLAPSGLQCTLLQAGYPTPGGTLTLDLHVGVVDPVVLPYLGPAVPSLNSIEAGVGPWALVSA